MKDAYTVLEATETNTGFAYDVLVTDLEGKAEFLEEYGRRDMSPGTVVDIAKLGIKQRYLHDGSWEAHEVYREPSEDGVDPETAVMTELMNDLISDDEIADLIAEIEADEAENQGTSDLEQEVTDGDNEGHDSSSDATTEPVGGVSSSDEEATTTDGGSGIDNESEEPTI